MSAGAPPPPQEASGGSLNGSYSAAQAQRGKRLSADNCAACHGEDLGGGQAPPLAGDAFLSSWDGRTVADLYDRIRTTMPAQAPGSLSSAEYADVLTFLLQANNVSPGERELQGDSPELKTLIFRKPTR